MIEKDGGGALPEVIELSLERARLEGPQPISGSSKGAAAPKADFYIARDLLGSALWRRTRFS